MRLAGLLRHLRLNDSRLNGNNAKQLVQDQSQATLTPALSQKERDEFVMLLFNRRFLNPPRC